MLQELYFKVILMLMYYVMGLFLQIILIWLYLSLQYLLYIALLIAGWWRGLIQNIETCIPTFKTLNLCLKYLELNALIFSCTEHSQMFQIPVGASINMHTVNWLQPQRWCGACCIPATRHREGTSLGEINSSRGNKRGCPPASCPLPIIHPFTKTEANL